MTAKTDRTLPAAVHAPGGKPVAELAGMKLTWERQTAAPLFSVEPWADGRLVLLTAQFPFEVPTSGGGLAVPGSGGGCGFLYLSVDGVESEGWLICPYLDRIRAVGTGCTTLYTSSCVGDVLHANLGRASNQNPAVPGEVVTIYALGLGFVRRSPTMVLPTGVAPLASDVLAYPPKLIFEYSSEPVVRRRVPVPNGGLVWEMEPLYLGVAPGQVGLYQINFVVPPIPPEVPACTSFSPNAMLSIVGFTTVEGVGFCVAKR